MLFIFAVLTFLVFDFAGRLVDWHLPESDLAPWMLTIAGYFLSTVLIAMHVQNILIP